MDLFSSPVIAYVIHLQGGPEKNCTKFMQHNFATVRHRVGRFLANCSERTKHCNPETNGSKLTTWQTSAQFFSETPGKCCGKLELVFLVKTLVKLLVT